MPLKEGAIRKLSSDELFAIIELPQFCRQKDELFDALRLRSDLRAEQFLKVHNLPDCKLGYVHDYTRRVRFVDIDFVASGFEHKLHLKCTKHGVSSEIFTTQSFNGEYQLSDLPELK
jgi:hypothetical protein